MDSIKGQTFFITGGSGFIGSNLSERLINEGARVIVYDNLNTGRQEYIQHLIGNKNFEFVKGDVLDKDALSKAMKGKGVTTIIHLAANGDIQKGTNDTTVDLNQGTIATYNVLEEARKCDVKNIAYSSSSVVYGLAKIKPAPEDLPSRPISLYGASKASAETEIMAFSYLFGMNYYIFRYANIIGKNQSRGVVPDLMRKIGANSKELEVLGDGNQTKSYLNINDCMNGMILIMTKSKSGENIYNLGNDDRISVREIAEMIVAKAAPGANIRYTGSQGGWKGDIADTSISVEKIKKEGFLPSMNSRKAIENSINGIMTGKW
jgi:UDP-glucose 4-epimerase